MKRLAFRCLSLAAVVTLFTLASLTQVPQAEAIGDCRCMVVSQSLQCWGKGSTCAAAETNLAADCWSRADGECGVEGACSVTVTSQGACFWNGMMYQIDGTASYRCILCIDKDP